jgi:formylglycine-generating enzyme required for sulfatase activity
VYGAVDMAGNVREWVADWFDSNYYTVSPARNPIGPDPGTERVVRGGSYRYSFAIARVALRHSLRPSTTEYDLGFRCAYSEP